MSWPPPTIPERARHAGNENIRVVPAAAARRLCAGELLLLRWWVCVCGIAPVRGWRLWPGAGAGGVVAALPSRGRHRVSSVPTRPAGALLLPCAVVAAGLGVWGSWVWAQDRSMSGWTTLDRTRSAGSSMCKFLRTAATR